MSQVPSSQVDAVVGPLKPLLRSCADPPGTQGVWLSPIRSGIAVSGAAAVASLRRTCLLRSAPVASRWQFTKLVWSPWDGNDVDVQGSPFYVCPDLSRLYSSCPVSGEAGCAVRRRTARLPVQEGDPRPAVAPCETRPLAHSQRSRRKKPPTAQPAAPAGVVSSAISAVALAASMAAVAFVSNQAASASTLVPG